MEISPEVLAAKKALELPLLMLPGVNGVGLGAREENGQVFLDELAVRILVEDLSSVPDGLPKEVAGVPVCLIEGSIVPCSADPARYETLEGGIMITHPLRGHGTLGAIVQDADTGELLGLTCAHVVGDPADAFPNTVWQPTNPPLAQGTTIPRDDDLGPVLRVDLPHTPPLPFSPVVVGLVDAAVFGLGDARDHGRGASPAVVGATPATDLVERVTATAVPRQGQTARKRGFETGLTTGFVIDTNFCCPWRPGSPNAFLMDQGVVAASVSDTGVIFAALGDSGALVLDGSSATALGVLYGVRPGTGQGVFSWITNVEAQLRIHTVWQ